MADEKKKHHRQEEEPVPEESKDLEPEETGTGEPADGKGEAEGEHHPEQDWQQEKEELLDQLKRKQADLENLRRIAKKEQAEAREYALHQFLCRLLPVVDNLERALESARSSENMPAGHIEGLEMIHRQLMQILEQEGVSRIEAEGCQFDPNCHHAVLQDESSESEPGTVLEELQKGYRHRSRILRPSMVKVCR